MKTIKSLKQIERLSGSHQVTAQELINGRLYTEKEGWIDIQLTNDFKEEFISAISEMYGGYKETKRRIKNTLRYEKPQHWGLTRTVIYNYGKGPRWTYITGQDQSWENREIRNYLKK